MTKNIPELESVLDRLKELWHLRTDDHDRKIMANKPWTNIGKKNNQTVERTLPCKSHIILCEEKWRVFEEWWRNIQKKGSEKWEMKCSEVQWSEVAWIEV